MPRASQLLSQGRRKAFLLLRRHHVWLLAVVVAVVTVQFQHRRQQDPHVRYTRFELPAFDAHVYVAMAEHPTVFTVAPWGYRVLTAWAVKALPVPKVVRGFRYLAIGALTAAGVLLFSFLGRLGHGPWWALLAVAVYGLSEPVARAVRFGFLSEPLSLLLLVAFLFALEAGAGLGLLCGLLTLGALSKEILLLLVPLVFFDRWGRQGWWRAVAAALVVALPGLVATLLLRVYWVPHIGSTLPVPAPDVIPAALGLILAGWGDWLWPSLLYGVTPLAVLGALRQRSRAYLRRYGYLVIATGALPFLAGLYVGESTPTHFFAADVPRLLIYALPLWLPLALTALAPLTRPQQPLSRWRRRPLLEGAAAVLTLGLLAGLPFALDRYRRIDLRGPADGPLALGLTRESLRTASRLERGQSVSFDAESQSYEWGVSDPGTLGRMRWFLRSGWGPRAHYGTGDIVMGGPNASLLLPCFRPAALEAVLALYAEKEVGLTAFVNGLPVGEVRAGPGEPESIVHVPRRALFRGDNLLTLAVKDGVQGLIRLRRLTYRPASGP